MSHLKPVTSASLCSKVALTSSVFIHSLHSYEAVLVATGGTGESLNCQLPTPTPPCCV